MSPQSVAVLSLGIACIVVFGRAMGAHFRADHPVAPGMILLRRTSALFFAWFVVDMLTGTACRAWPLACVLFACSLGIFEWSRRASLVERPTLAFTADRPTFLIRRGPYARVRHPFYTAYLVFWVAAAIGTGGDSFWFATGFMASLYRAAARMEERKFAASTLSGAYADYRRDAGMFLPRMSAPARRASSRLLRQLRLI